MYIYLDERGDLGFDFSKKGTSRKFVITLLVCDDRNTQRQFKKAISRTIRNKIFRKRKIDRYVELKGTNTSLAIKQYFLRLIHSENWRIYSVVLNKQNIAYEIQPAGVKHKLYNFLARFLIERLPLSATYTNVQLIVDRCKNREQIREFNRYLQTHIEGQLPLKTAFNVEHLDSHEDAGLQAVDMFCWGIGRKYECSDTEWYQCYQDKIAFETEYLKNG